jgi:DNA-binding CsgD family transcriptional regulator
LERVSAQDFLSAPVGRYAAVGPMLVGCPDAGLRICAIWGRPDGDTARDLLALLRVVFHPEFAGGVEALTDVAELEWVDPGGFYTLIEGLTLDRARYRQRIRRQAFVRPRSLVGAVVGGLYELVGRTFPVRSFSGDDRRRAFGWLDRPDAPALAEWLAATLEARRDPLTPREAQAVELASRGHSNKVIAFEMNVSPSTVGVLLFRASRKLRARTRAELISAFRQQP